ncbi:hypothetical protein V502_02383 [Pseudogymnoascus sp. VKM F-4520 (FW-2644)]|nr:hypothetical protein V502_02383 [Pseudogymnoascus sp. VKM F-4520 (FW-2644)]
MFDVEEVLGLLTSAEKTSLLSGSDFWHTAEFPQHKVPKIRFSDACIPCGTALGATWDKQLLKMAGELLGQECIAKGAHCWLGPTINTLRSPLGGRGFESYSEDPHLSGILASNIIIGCESTGVISVVKHFVCNDQEEERRAVDTLVTQRALREIYARPFQIVARDARPGGLMTAYNKVNGCHVSQDLELLDGLVRQEWGWDPMMISDWFGTYSTERALNAGLDLEMPGKSRYRGPLVDFALASRLVTQKTIDQRVRKVLSFVKRASATKVATTEGARDSAEDRELNRALCANSIVLLKNEGSTLPLRLGKGTRIALIGSHMKSPAISGGSSASLDPYYKISLFDAIKSRLSSDAQVDYEIGAYAHKMLPFIDRCITHSPNKSSSAVIRFFNEPWSEGCNQRECIGEEPLQNLYFQLMDYNRNPKLNYDLFYASIEADFTPDVDGLWDFGLTVCGTANLYVNDELVIENTTDQRPGDAFFKKGTAEKVCQLSMEVGKSYKLRIEFGSSNTSKLMQVGVVSFGGGGARLGACPCIDIDDNIAKAAALAAKSDYAILCTGLSGEWESEGFDRKHMDLPPHVDDLISRVLAANPRTVIVNQSGAPVSMPWIQSAKVVVQAWYGGNESGNGTADVLFGDCNPSGRLPFTWPAKLKDNPSYGNFGSVGGRVLYGEDVFVGYRHYDLVDRDPLFCFGHGLSYTEFSLANLSVSRSNISLDVSNAGPFAGATIIQVYISAKDSQITRPCKELQGFDKVYLEQGQSKRIEISIDKLKKENDDEDYTQVQIDVRNVVMACLAAGLRGG